MTSDAPTREYCKKSWKGKPREVLNVAVVAGRVDTVRLGHPWAANPVELRDWSSGMTDPCPGSGLCARASCSRPLQAGRRWSLVTATGHSQPLWWPVHRRGGAFVVPLPLCLPTALRLLSAQPKSVASRVQPRSGGIFIAPFLIKQR